MSAGWSLLLLTTLMGAALVGTTALSLSAAHEATDSLVRSQGYSRLRELSREARQRGQRPLPPDLLARHLGPDEGGHAKVFYLLTLDPLSGHTTEAGESQLGRERLLKALREGSRATQTIVEGNLAVLIRRLPAGSAQRARHAGAVPREELTLVAVEFTPDEANRLQRAASRTLAAGGIAALLLILTSAAMARSLRKRAVLERRLADERSLAVLGEMSAVLAHEIRNPLASLKGHAQLLEESLEDNEPAQKKAQRVVAEALRLERLSAELLDFVRSAKVEPTSTPLRELLEACVSAVPEASVQLQTETAPAAWTLDADRLQQAVTNLLQNAAQAAPEGIVVLSAEQVAAELVLRIRDEGPGVPLDQREQIFQPFFTTRTRGTGLGLAVARRVIELHGGTIEVLSPPAGGAEFCVRLPQSPDARP